MKDRKRILHFEVGSDSQAAELDAAWQGILSGRRVRLSAAAEETAEIVERARIGLKTIVNAIERNPGTGHSRRLTRFLAGMYNGGDYPFDLTDLRTLDADLANACIDYLNYDRLGKVEVHTHLPGGGKQINWFIVQHGICRQLHLSSTEAHEERIHALAERLDRDPADFLKEALSDLLARYDSKAFENLLATRPSPDTERPLFHARILTESVVKPLCGATDGPWSPRGFDYVRLTCRDCQALVLEPPPPTDRL